MRIILVCGFLGSGKTTMIRELAAHMVMVKGLRMVILENEVGEVGIDDRFLAGEGFQVKGIFGGCICCQLTGEVTAAVNEIGREFSPDAVVIEATGVARPSPVLEVLLRYGEGICAVTVVDLVDAGRWAMLSEVVPGLIMGQIRESDVVLLNKIDECEDDLVENIRSLIAAENPAARIYAVSAAGGLPSAILEEFGEGGWEKASYALPEKEKGVPEGGAVRDA